MIAPFPRASRYYNRLTRERVFLSILRYRSPLPSPKTVLLRDPPADDETGSNSAVKQEPPEVELDDDAIDDDTSHVRGPYHIDKGRALAGPLSVNDPEFASFSRGGINTVLSESFFTLCSPFGPPGARNMWRMQSREAPEHVHRLLRAFVAAQDYAGAARALATLHRLMVSFDPDVYRYTSALLRLAGDHQVRSSKRSLGHAGASSVLFRLKDVRAVVHSQEDNR